MLAVPSKCFQVPTFVPFVTTATTPVKAPIIYDLDYCSPFLTGLPVSALALLRSLLNTAAKVILLNCASGLSLLPQNSLAAFHLTQSESQRPHGGLWGLPLPFSVRSHLIDLLAVPEIHQACCQLGACVHAVPPVWCLDALPPRRQQSSPSHFLQVPVQMLSYLEGLPRWPRIKWHPPLEPHPASPYLL